MALNASSKVNVILNVKFNLLGKIILKANPLWKWLYGHHLLSSEIYKKVLRKCIHGRWKIDGTDKWYNLKRSDT